MVDEIQAAERRKNNKRQRTAKWDRKSCLDLGSLAVEFVILPSISGWFESRVFTYVAVLINISGELSDNLIIITKLVALIKAEHNFLKP